MYEVIINKKENAKTIILLENGNIVEKYEEREDINRIEGNIYIGKVQNVLPGMQAAFVDIGENKNTFIHLKDVLPKVDERIDSTKEMIDASDIKKIIKPGMPLLVQVKRDSTSKKGARVSTHISLPGKYIVFMPNASFITISQKIENKEEKNRLINIVQSILPKDCGAIIRTSCEEKNEEVIREEIKKLTEEWEQIQKLGENCSEYPKMIYEQDTLLKKLFIDMVEKKIDKVTVNDLDIYNEVQEIVRDISINSIKIELIENKDLIDEYYLQGQLDKIDSRKIWLKCGGFITIDKTEALTAIDVNSGKYIGTKNLEQTVYTVNKEATIEIAKQLRLRDIGGIIIIDYIDMDNSEHKDKIIETLVENLRKDRSKTQVIGFTPLNLLEMTRKHIASNE